MSEDTRSNNRIGASENTWDTKGILKPAVIYLLLVGFVQPVGDFLLKVIENDYFGLNFVAGLFLVVVIGYILAYLVIIPYIVAFRWQDSCGRRHNWLPERGKQFQVRHLVATMIFMIPGLWLLNPSLPWMISYAQWLWTGNFAPNTPGWLVCIYAGKNTLMLLAMTVLMIVIAQICFAFKMIVIDSIRLWWERPRHDNS